MALEGIAQALWAALAVLDRFEIPYFVGGSVASSNYGMPRLTNDIDIVVELEGVRLDDFAAALQPDFYLDAESIRTAMREHRAYNAIHMASAFKLGFFPVAGNEFLKTEMARRRVAASTLPGLEGTEFHLASPEDILLAKLDWYRRGGSISERQWHDILGLLRVQASRLDSTYLNEWARKLGVADLLQQARG